jgi:alpha-tubulin suppressor-like RCC1 family protein
MYGWGGNSLGHVGDGTAVARSSPVQIGALTNWLQVSGGLYRHTLATKTDGTLWAWGRNTNGELGLNNTTDYSSPKQVGALTNWLYVSPGEFRTYAIKTNGTMWAWGRNNQHGGELGTGDSTINRSSPTQIGALTTWSKVRGAAGGHVIALKTDGSIYGWGRNSAGQAGLGDTAVQSNPTQIGSDYNWTGIGVGQYHSFAW